MDKLFFLGPCSIESKEQLELTLKFFQDHNIKYIFRGGLFKMRTSPDSFQGLREQGVDLIKEMKTKYNFKYASEISSLEQLELIKDIVDYIQIGARSMYNYELLSKIGSYNKPVILKRGFSATIEEWTKAAKYIELGNPNVEILLCERGVRGFDNKFRNLLDLQSALYIKKETNYKILIDPSHASGLRDYVEDLSVGCIAAGVDGLMVEVHPFPEKAWSDKDQAIDLETVKRIYKRCEKLSKAE
jgi:3-deoxy-7-phosphoheptulonate synthase